MPLNSPESRFSMMGVGVPSILVTPPNGSVGTSQRASVMHLYGGIPFDVPVEINRLQRDWDYETGHTRTLKVTTYTDSLKVKIGDE